MDQDGVILISDEEDEESCHVNDSVLIVEDSVQQEPATTVAENEVVDDDLSVTFSKKATVLPHARYDCNSCPFSPSENDTANPVGENSTFCEQCFCYICDKLASECDIWETPGISHCNAHKRSAFWKGQRNRAILGYLHVFNFDVMEVDADLRLAEGHLLKFEAGLTDRYGTFLRGVKVPFSSISPCSCFCHTTSPNTAACKKCKSRHVDVMVYNYSKVFECVSEFLDKAVKEQPKTAAVMLLGAARLFITHSQPPGVSPFNDPKANVMDAVALLLMRVTNVVRTLMVSSDFSNSFSKKLQMFFRMFPLPTKCAWLVNSLDVLPWDNPLLVAVLRGQNITGERCSKGKKEVLFELLPVVEARVKGLKEQCKYRELIRYLKVVKTDNKPQLQVLRDHIPLYLCQIGDFSSALSSFFSTGVQVCCSACRLTPIQFTVYLKILTTGMVPVGDDPFTSTQWEVIKGAKHLKKSEIIKCGLRIFHRNTEVFLNSESWTNFIKVACSEVTESTNVLIPASFSAPDVAFLMIARDAANAILLDKSSGDNQFQIPNRFLHPYQDQALLILVTQAFLHRVFQCRMAPVLSTVMAFRDNAWALQWFYNSLSTNPEIAQIFFRILLDDLYGNMVHCTSRKLESSDSDFIAEFLTYCIQDPRPALYPLRRFLLDDLQKHWNEYNLPWKHHLRMLLLQVHTSELAPDVVRFLDMTQRRAF